MESVKQVLNFSSISKKSSNSLILKSNSQLISDKNSPVDNKYISFDRTIHRILSAYNKLLFHGDVKFEDLVSLLPVYWISKGYESIAEEIEFRNDAKEALKGLHECPQDRGVDCIVVDKLLTQRLNNISTLGCRIDKLNEVENGFFEVIDYKSGKTIHSMSNMFNKIAVSATLINNKYGFYPQFYSCYYLRYGLKLTQKIDHIYIREVNSYINSLPEKIYHSYLQRLRYPTLI